MHRILPAIAGFHHVFEAPFSDKPSKQTTTHCVIVPEEFVPSIAETTI
jgi:hypothetical protein